jgi:hypothetical protein
MQTLTEITAEDRARRARAQRYETLTNKAAGLKLSIQRLDALRLNTDALQQIHALCGDVPREALTNGVSSLGFAIPNGMIARDVLMVVAGSALADARRREQERERQLANARAELAAAEAELQELS